jgi:hypothetical protein
MKVIDIFRFFDMIFIQGVLVSLAVWLHHSQRVTPLFSSPNLFFG